VIHTTRFISDPKLTETDVMKMSIFEFIDTSRLNDLALFSASYRIADKRKYLRLLKVNNSRGCIYVGTWRVKSAEA